MILARAPSLIISAITRRNMGLFALALDLAVPPLVLLGLLTIGALFLASLAAWFVGSYAALIISVGSLAVFATTVLLSWIVFARDILPPHALWSIVPYALAKIRPLSALCVGRPCFAMDQDRPRVGDVQ